MATQQEVIKKFMKSLDKTTKKPAQALDAAVKACSNFKSVQAVFNQMISDRKKAANAEDFLRRYCGIFFGQSRHGRDNRRGRGRLDY